MHTHARDKSLEDGIFKNIYSKKRSFLAFGSEKVIPQVASLTQSVAFPSESPKKQCDRITLTIQVKQRGKDTNRFDDDIVAKNDKLLE